MAASTALMLLLGGRALVNSAATAQQIASQAKLLKMQAGLVMKSAEESKALAYEQAVLYGRTAEENARAAEYAGDQNLMYEEIAGMQRIGGIRAKSGSSGASVNVGTPANLQIAQAQANAFNQRMIKYNTKYEAARTRLDGEQKANMTIRQAEIQYDRAVREAKYYETQAAEVRATKALATLSSILGGAASVMSAMPAPQDQPLQPVENNSFMNSDFMQWLNRSMFDYNDKMRKSRYRSNYTDTVGPF